jgi:ATP-dependent Lon protease
VDYIAEVLKHLRTEDFTGAYKKYFEITSEVSTRDQTGFEKTFSGLVKILYPDGNATAEETEELLSFSMEARRRVREHILRIDDTFKRHDFVYRAVEGGRSVTVLTPEEIQYPVFAAPKSKAPEAEEGGEAADDGVMVYQEQVMQISNRVAGMLHPRCLMGSQSSRQRRSRDMWLCLRIPRAGATGASLRAI